MSSTKLKVIFFGTPDFSVPTLEVLHKSQHVDLKAVITMPDRPAGRGKDLKSPPVATYALENRIRLFQTENVNKDADLIDYLESEEFSFFMVIAFAQFLGDKVLNLPKLGAFNIHTSLLPKYRGAAPIQYALLNGDQSTGVCIQKMVKKMDAGDIVHEHPCSIRKDETSIELFTRLKFLSAIATEEFIQKIITNKLEAKPQTGEASFAPTIKKEDGHIDFSNLSYKDLKNRFRAFYPWPGLYFFFNKKRLKIHSIGPSHKDLKPGQLCVKFGSLDIGCKDGSARLTSIQPENKKTQTDIEFLNGIQKGRPIEIS